jgi:hypothetical protein
MELRNRRALPAWWLSCVLLSGVAGAEQTSFQLSIQSGDQTIAPRVLRATKGERVAIEWSTDKPVAVHIHAYDVEQDVSPGKSSRNEFVASVSGRFPIEAHFAARRKIVAYLEVLPR